MAKAIKPETKDFLSRVKRVKSVTCPLLKLELDVPYYLRFETEIRKAEETEKDKRRREADTAAGKTVMEVPQLCRVVDLESGELCEMIVPMVLHEELFKAYPDDAYVGKSFELYKHKLENKRYSVWDIAEIELTDE